MVCCSAGAVCASGCRDAHPSVPHLQQHLIPVPVYRHKDPSATDIVLNGVFHQVKTDLRQVIFRTQHGAAGFQVRRRFVSDASHELKTPLASIRLLADSILQTDEMDPA